MAILVINDCVELKPEHLNHPFIERIKRTCERKEGGVAFQIVEDYMDEYLYAGEVLDFGTALCLDIDTYTVRYLERYSTCYGCCALTIEPDDTFYLELQREEIIDQREIADLLSCRDYYAKRKAMDCYDVLFFIKDENKAFLYFEHQGNIVRLEFKLVEAEELDAYWQVDIYVATKKLDKEYLIERRLSVHTVPEYDESFFHGW